MKFLTTFWTRTVASLTAALVLPATQAWAACNSDCLNSADHLGIPAIGLGSAAKDIISTLSFIAGVLSAFFIVVAGIRYATSSGNSQRTEGAKQTLTYAVIGLIISILAFAIVGFITAKAPQ